MDNRPIGVFDSGLGGLSCVDRLSRILPEESIIYFGDTARTPYGDKDAETIRYFTSQIADFLVSKDVKMLLIACNTVSALCVDFLRERYPQLPIIGIVEPTAALLAGKTDLKKNVGIIATKATVKSGIYESLLQKKGLTCPVFSQACPLFVPLIESGFRSGVVVDTVAHHYLDDFIGQNEIGTLILGCTHYPFMKDSIQKLYPGVSLVNPSEIGVDEAARILSERGMKADPGRSGELTFYASDLSATFLEMIREITGDENVAAKFKSFRSV